MGKNMSQDDKKFIGIGVFVLILIGALFVVFGGFDTVDASEKGVKVKFGKVQGVMEPGRQWTGMFVDVHPYNLRIRNMEVKLEGDQAAVDKDGQEVYAIIKVNYRLKPDRDTVLNAYSNLGKDKNLEALLNVNGLVKEGFKSVIARYELKDILADRSKIKEEAMVSIREKFPADYFLLENIVIENFDFNKEIKAAINKKKVATESAKAKEEELKVAEANKAITIMEAEAELEKSKKETDAEAYKKERIAEAEALALRLQKQEINQLLVDMTYARATEVFASKFNGQLPTTMLGSNPMMMMQMPSSNSNNGQSLLP